jgi:hypothetical protein
MHRILAVFFLLALSAAAAACPVPAEGGGKLELHAGQLARRHVADAIAGGALDLAHCGSVRGAGFVSGVPTFNLHLRGPEPPGVELRTEADCDTVLMISNGGGRWLFDDDSGGGANAALRLSAPRAGRYDIWIGTFGPASCRARLLVTRAG